MPHQPFEYLRDVLPECAKQLEAALRRIKRRDLASQVKELRVYGRCDCGSKCGTFYCLPREAYQQAARFGSDITGVVTESKGKIIRVETLDAETGAALAALFPDAVW
jgi:hypothetical protein